MNVGQNMLDWLTQQALPILMIGIVCFGIYLIFKRELSRIVGFAIVALLATGFVLNPHGIVNLFLSIYNKIIGS